MREAVFIRKNKPKWEEYEQRVQYLQGETPDDLADMYLDLTSDLAFAQTQYPNSAITTYLNDLALTLHNQIYVNKRESLSRLRTFWTREVPDAVWAARRPMLASLCIFVLAILIGILSTAGDASFARFILGDGYVDMTLQNIEQGNPMGVYGSEGEAQSFYSIFFNNAGLDLKMFAAGVLTSVVSVLYLLYNGLLLGVFGTFLYQQGVLAVSVPTVMLHGTIELSTIVLMGGASIMLGNGWLFPGTFSRIVSFKRAARQGVKILLGVLPFTFIAAVIESWFSRYTFWSLDLKMLVIITSAILVVGYFIVLPYRRNHRHDPAAA